ncbi:hypothetical protein ARZXY2_4572 (plasmid) [Arthrobacter sp. ZXY-2]|nr:hypothetical protein ARZXY2_4572 [Arthrobacter sp. ZXY-2]
MPVVDISHISGNVWRYGTRWTFRKWRRMIQEGDLDRI